MSTKAKQHGSRQTKKSSSPTLQDYVEHLRFSSPFSLDRVTQPSEQEVDVKTIHGEKFDQLVRLANQACREKRGIGVVLWGEAGIGKSHLLARFSRWAKGQEKAHYVFLHNIQAGPDRLPRYVLKCTISSLAAAKQSNFADTELFKLLNRVMMVALQQAGLDPKSKPTEAKLRESYQQFIETQRSEHFATAEVDDQPIYAVLLEFFLAAYWSKQNPACEAKAALALRWLEGDLLDVKEAKQLGIPTAGLEEISLSDDQAVQRVLVVLMRLAQYRDKPFILCFDQIENLSEPQVCALSQFTHSLIDAAANLLLVTSGVQEDILGFLQNSYIRPSGWDRLAEQEVRLNRIDVSEAKQLLESRLEHFNEPYLAIPEIRGHITSDTLFPLGQQWMDAECRDVVELRPRDVVRKARSQWNVQRDLLDQHGEATWIKNWPLNNPIDPGETTDLRELLDQTVERRIKEQVRRRELEPSTLPPDAANLCGLVEGLLLQCQGVDSGYTFVELEKPKARSGKKLTYDLIVHERCPNGHQIRNGLAFIDSGSTNSVTASLKRLLDDTSSPDHVLLVTLQGKPLKLAKTGKKHFDKLLARGEKAFEHIELTSKQYAELDALMAVVGQAKSGDLELDLPSGESRPVTAAEVIESHHRQDRYRKHTLLRELLTEEPKIADTLEPDHLIIKDKDLRTFIKAQLALTQGSTSVELSHKFWTQWESRDSVTMEVVRGQLEKIAQEMHKDKQINAQPMDDHLFLLNRPN